MVMMAIQNMMMAVIITARLNQEITMSTPSPSQSPFEPPPSNSIAKFVKWSVVPLNNKRKLIIYC